ncbi:MAG: FG-GAP repeat domain-containing protein, partial [Pyrinomonadaceae bacterium]
MVKDSDSGAYLAYTLGTSSAKAAPGDFNGDGLIDPGVFEAGTWTYKLSPNTSGTTYTASFGTTGDVPVVGDYDGDLIMDLAFYRPSAAEWHVKRSSDAQIVITSIGAASDVPVVGDFDGDGLTDKTVFHPSTGEWNVLKSGGGSLYFEWGKPGEVPAVADFDADGKTDITVYSPANGGWYIKTSSSNFLSEIEEDWGSYGDQPLPADYDGDGFADFAVWRPVSGTWHVKGSSSKYSAVHTLGSPGDTAVPSAYIVQVAQMAYSETLGRARLDPKNETGATNPYSQNFSWGAPLVSLPGRAGLDAGLSLSYNSLVWVRDNETNEVVFDSDAANVSPGFRFGVPTLEPKYYDSAKDKFVWLMVLPSGRRVEFIQKQASGTQFESTDSSFTQLFTKFPGPLDPPPPPA